MEIKMQVSDVSRSMSKGEPVSETVMLHGKVAGNACSTFLIKISDPAQFGTLEQGQEVMVRITPAS